MTLRLILIAVLVATAACAHREPSLPECGGARRPANPHGSILVPTPPATEPTAPAPEAGGCA